MTTPPGPERRPDRFYSIDRPVLFVIAESLDSTRTPLLVDALPVPGISDDDVRRAVLRLAEGDYIDVAGDGGTYGPDMVMIVVAVRERGLRELGDWPSLADPIASLAAALTAAAEKTAEPDERSRLQRAAAAVGNLTGTLATEVLKAHTVSILGPH